MVDDSEAEEVILLPPDKYRHMRTDKVTVYWVSFLDGLQRVLLFTQDERVANRAKQVKYNVNDQNSE